MPNTAVKSRAKNIVIYAGVTSADTEQSEKTDRKRGYISKREGLWETVKKMLMVKKGRLVGFYRGRVEKGERAGSYWESTTLRLS